MQYKTQQTIADQQENSLRYKLLGLFRVNLYYESPTLSLLETALQIFNYIQLLKFAVDYFALHWLSTLTPVFLYLDPAYYSTLLPTSSQNTFLIACMIVMNCYWMIQVAIFMLGLKYSPTMATVRKTLFLLFRHLLLIPFFSILLGMYACQANETFRPCLAVVPITIQFAYVVSYAAFAILIGGQIYFNFLFLPHEKQYTRLKKSNHSSLLFFLYLITCQGFVFALNDTAQLAVLNIATILFLGFLWWREEQLEEKAKLIQISGIASMLLGIMIVNFSFALGSQVQIWVYLLLCAGVWGGVMQVRTYSMKFELENINKWPTADIMIRQASTIRYYLSRGDEHMFKIYVHGYMQVHRQKCDNVACPSRVDLSEYDRHLQQKLGYDHNTQQLLRINNILKVIYGAGYRLSPIPPQIQLQNCTYQFMRGEYELSLRNLLQIRHQEMSYDGYYVYVLLKEILSQKILSGPQTEFLDLVTQLNLKKREEQLFKLFQSAALINLEFWSLLNDDHPDFQKLNEVGIERMQVDAKVREEFETISRWANSQKIVGLYSSYLQCIDNDQELVMDIEKTLAERYKLKEKLVVHDWNNSSSGTLLVSLEEATFGKILDLNTSCASFLGYQKHQLINQTAKILWPNELSAHVKSLLIADTNDKVFYLCHKSGYLVSVTKNARNFNSMENGLTALLTINPLLQPLSCHCVIDKNNKIIASSASCVPLLSLDFKAFQGEALASIFFQFSYSTVGSFKQVYAAQQLLKGEFGVRAKEKSELEARYIIKQEERYGFKFVQIRRLKIQHLINKNVKGEGSVANFQFQVHLNTSKLKYVGSANNLSSSISEFGRQTLSMSSQVRKKTNYAEGISTLRLINNIVQLIDEPQSAESQQFIQRDQLTASLQEIIPRQDQQEIFSSKGAYQQFLKGFKIGYNLFWVMRGTIIFVLGLYVVSYVLYRNNHQSTIKYSKQITYQNLIIGSIAKQSAIVSQLQLMASNKSSQTPSRLINIYNDNLNYLQTIQLLGTSPFTFSYFINQSGWQTSLTSQYISTIINYASALQTNLNGATTQQQVSAAFNATDSYTISFLLSGSTVKDSLLDAFNARKNDIVADISTGKNIAIVVVSIGVILTVLMGIFILLWVRNLNNEKIRVLQIFLEISDPQIQYFSSMSERFLLSIHSDETADLQEDIQNAKKTFSSTFAKKKSFKLIAFNKSFYVKLALVPLLMTAFFFHTYAISDSYIAMQTLSIDYFALTAQGDYYLSTGSLKLSQAQKNNTLLNLPDISQAVRLYYRAYFDKDEVTFGLYANFHTVFDAVMYGNICAGSQTPYGWVSINQSCSLPLLYPNGTFLVLSSTLTQIERWDQKSPLDLDFHLKMQVLSKSQRKLSEMLLLAEQQLSDAASGSILQGLAVWSGVVLVVSIIVWEMGGKSFVVELNEIKSILGMLPLSLVKQIPLASRYINRILKQKHTC